MAVTSVSFVSAALLSALPLSTHLIYDFEGHGLGQVPQTQSLRGGF